MGRGRGSSGANESEQEEKIRPNLYFQFGLKLEEEPPTPYRIVFTCFQSLNSGSYFKERSLGLMAGLPKLLLLFSFKVEPALLFDTSTGHCL